MPLIIVTLIAAALRSLGLGEQLAPPVQETQPKYPVQESAKGVSGNDFTVFKQEEIQKYSYGCRHFSPLMTLKSPATTLEWVILDLSTLSGTN